MALGALLASLPATGAQLLNEPFTYADGNLTAVSGGLWVAHSAGGVRPIQVTSGKAIVVQGGGSGEDDGRGFAARAATAATYACLEVTVPSQAAVADDRYFFHFFTTAGFNFRARLFVGPPTAGGNFRFKIDNDAAPPDTPYPVDSFFDITYRIVVKYDAATNSATLWVDPLNEASTSVTSSGGIGGVDAIDRVALRQDSAGNTTQVVDNLVVGEAFGDCGGVTPTRESTWGRMKALYR
ncbi:MAG: hypothetical protein ACRENJ_06625 [Candidatus Eiseniibacteriota bacterium]